MKKKSTSKSAFFNLRVLIDVCVILTSALLALVSFGTFSNASAQAGVGNTALSLSIQDQVPGAQQFGETTVIPAERNDLSPPLRDQPAQLSRVQEEREAHVHPPMPTKHTDVPDPVIQGSFWQAGINAPIVSAPTRQWAGISKAGCGACSYPPDTSGAVGKTQYVQLTSIDALQVFDKLTGTPLLGPISMASLWSGFGGTCENGESGDPVVVYDKLADRWIISQFATPSGVRHPQNECIAVSQTNDATGQWYRYGFQVTTQFVDYMKFGVWPDGYYMSANIYTNEFRPRWLGPQAFVFDRAKMLLGAPTTIQTPGIVRNTNRSFLPSDLDGILPPPPGEPNHFVWFPEEDAPPPRESQPGTTATATPTATPAFTYKVWAFHVDWDQPANSAFTSEANIPASGFTDFCATCRVPQRGTTSQLDTLVNTLMFRNAYRRFPDGRASMFNNFTVRANSVAGIRWFELQRTLSTNWALRQESSYQPDATWRWMGSIASDNKGNVALGFSASSATIYPQIRYAGRRATDPLNILAGEQHLFDGTGSQTDTENRWGDYSQMTVDPVDDCTFYYANEYYATTSSANWKTRIGYFKFSECTPPEKGTAHFVICDRGIPSIASVSIDGISYGASIDNGTYDPVLPPGSHTYVVSNPAIGRQTGNFTVTNGQTTLVEVCLGGRAAVGDFNGDGHPDYVLRNTSTRQTGILYLNNNNVIGAASGPTLPVNWGLRAVADFNQDGHSDYALLNFITSQTVIGYLSGPTVIGAAYGPSLPAGWQLVATTDFNTDGYPDYLIYNMNSRQTAIWYLNDNVVVKAAFGPTLPAGWTVVAAADFNGDGHPDYLLYNVDSRQTAIWYLNDNILINALYGPTLLRGWAIVAAADFDGDGHPDYVLYNASTRQTAIWYLNNNIFVSAAFGPSLPGVWSLVAP